jgi:enoyl-CoA hydratase
MNELATYERQGPIATITMDDGGVNALSVPMLRAVHAAFDQAERDRAVVVLTGRERCFSAGFDLKVFAGGGEPVLEMLHLGATLAERVLSFPTPVVVACTGHAVAAGAFLPLSADARLGADGPFQIGLSEVRIGLTVPWFAIEIARQRLHPAHFDRAVVCATMYSPSEAVAAGFLDRVLAPGKLCEASHQTAAALAELDPAAHAATKLRARGEALGRLRTAIEDELTPEQLEASSPPARAGQL